MKIENYNLNLFISRNKHALYKKKKTKELRISVTNVVVVVVENYLLVLLLFVRYVLEL
jgi:hypothetical protein